jgi:lactoylglutathione lyase
MPRIVHLSLAVEDVETASSFCEKVFGFTALNKPKKNGLRMTDGAINVAVNRCKAGESPTIKHLGVEVEDLDAFVADIRRHGCEVFLGGTGNKHFRMPGASGVEVEIIPVGSKPGISAR